MEIQYSKQAIKYLKKVQKSIIENFPHWGSIRVELPDELDKEMLEEISSDPDCKEFVSEEEALKELGI